MNQSTNSTTGPSLTLFASQVLSSDPDDDFGLLIKAFLTTPEVQEFLQTRARHLVANPLLHGHPDRERWLAFATAAQSQQVRGG